MNRTQLHQLAEDRLLDAQFLLSGGRWSAAYYLAGYALECGLKACVLALRELIGLADLISELDKHHPTSRFKAFWSVAIKWDEESRYQQKTQQEANELIEAITDNNDGVFRWIKTYW